MDTPKIACIESIRKQFENPMEWKLRRSFLTKNWKAFPMERLECLSHCFVNIEIYGSVYPQEVMLEVKRCSDGLVDEVIQKRRRVIGAPEPVQFVAASKNLNNNLEDKLNNPQFSRDPRINGSLYSPKISKSNDDNGKAQNFPKTPSACEYSKHKRIAFVAASSVGSSSQEPSNKKSSSLVENSNINNQTSHLKNDREMCKPIDFVTSSQLSTVPVLQYGSTKLESSSTVTLPSRGNKESNQTNNRSVEERFQLSEVHRILTDRADLCRQLIRSIQVLGKSKGGMNAPALVHLAAAKVNAGITTLFHPERPQLFKCTAWLEGDTLLAEGFAPSKKMAKSNAFELFLSQFKDSKIEVVKNKTQANTYCLICRDSLDHTELSSCSLPVKPESTIVTPRLENHDHNQPDNPINSDHPQFIQLCNSIFIIDFSAKMVQDGYSKATMNRIAKEFGLCIEYSIENSEHELQTSFSCKLFLNNMLISIGEGPAPKRAKRVAAIGALKKIEDRWTLLTKQNNTIKTEMSESDVLTKESASHTTIEAPISSSNIGAKLMQKMGYNEGMGLGRLNEGRVDPVGTDMTQSVSNKKKKGGTHFAVSRNSIMTQNLENQDHIPVSSDHPAFIQLCNSIFIIDHSTKTGRDACCTMNRIAETFKLCIEYLIENSENGQLNCKLFLNNILLSIGEGSTPKEAKRTAAIIALERIKERCWTLLHKQDHTNITEMSKTGITKEASHKTIEAPISSSNIGAKLMQKMGYKEGTGLGRLNEGRIEPVSTDMTQVNRSGLGCTSDTKEFQREISSLLENYARSKQEEDLLFSTEFTNDERKFIHRKGMQISLTTKSYNTDDGGRCLFVGRKRSPMELFDWVKRSGGNTTRYRLLPPGTNYGD